MGNTQWTTAEEAHLVYAVREQNLAKQSNVGRNKNKDVWYIQEKDKAITKLAKEISARYGNFRKAGALRTKFAELFAGTKYGRSFDEIADSIIETAIQDARDGYEDLQHTIISLNPDTYPECPQWVMIDVNAFKKHWTKGDINVYDCINKSTIC